ncbi:MAG: AraC family transcriptional regulator, partial [Sphingobacteriaceae bacterium]
MNNDFRYKFIQPEKLIANFVESLGMFHNQTDKAKEVVVMPDGRVDLFFWQTDFEPFQVIL